MDSLAANGVGSFVADGIDSFVTNDVNFLAANGTNSANGIKIPPSGFLLKGQQLVTFT